MGEKKFTSNLEKERKPVQINKSKSSVSNMENEISLHSLTLNTAERKKTIRH